MFDELYQEDQQARYNDINTRGIPPQPVKKTSLWSGFGSGSGLMTGAAETGRMLGIAGSIFARDLRSGRGETNSDFMRIRPTQPPDDRSGDLDAYLKTVDDLTKPAVDYWKPDPAKVGTATQIVNGFTGMAVPLMLGGGNPAFVAGSAQVSAYDDLTAQGVDGSTANTAATIRGITTAAGMMMPAALVPGKLAAAGAGAVANTALGMTDREATKLILEHANYDKIAAQYKPIDGVQMLVDGLSGGLMGAIAGRSKDIKPKIEATPEQHAAALVLNEIHNTNDSTLVTSGDPNAHTQATDMQVVAAKQLEAGEPVSVADHVQADPVLVDSLRQKFERQLEAQINVRTMKSGEPFTVMKDEEGYVAHDQYGDEIGRVTNGKVSIHPDFRDQGIESAFHVEPSIGERLQEKISSNLEAAKAEYASLAESKGGQVHNTDIARELSPDYLKDRTKSADVHEPASAFVKQMYADNLARPTPEGKAPLVIFTAGGTGAGKSTGLEHMGESAKSAEIIYDTNMNKFESSDQKIQQALKAGRNVAINYTFRDPIESLTHGALVRAARQERELGTGRTVPIDEHIKTHQGSAETIARLQAKYADDPRVSMHIIDNSNGAGKSKVSSLDALPQVDYIGIKEKLHEATIQEHQAGRISDQTFRGTTGQDPVQSSGIRPSSGPGDGGEPKQVGTRASTEGRASAEIDPVAALVAKNPDRLIRLDDGTDIRAADALAQADENIARAQKDQNAFQAAVSCFLSHGGG